MGIRMRVLRPGAIGDASLIGFVAHARRFRNALANGQVVAPARNADPMRQVIVNDRVDATLAMVFVGVVVALVVFSIRACVQGYRAEGWTTCELRAAQAVAAQ
jgi:carbon starvation protein